ncbi:sigma-70 family RNA polymerase sigma factor [Nocardioides bruguierae]|uniref:sigma-70 family RNA polymerase sigma factor n=1 Tax=Nocardioides bruguierae TaxID=2945102 RepID=UPI00201FE508|nr:sigma-70 family RNA polymerase sigma factor [Nocardioides bruguierae]MCL8026144.1 sigma-70 family RNA polymerase sigma factor [Nocardioides bruguierae]
MSAGPADDRHESHRGSPRPFLPAEAPSAGDEAAPATPLVSAVDAARLSDEERAQVTRTLLRRAHATQDEAERRACLDGVVEVNMRVAEAVARRYRDRGVALEDLRQVAYLALVRAVRSFDVSAGHDLLAYAVPSMTGEIRRHFRDHSWSVRPPRQVQAACTRLVRADRDLSRVGREDLEALAREVDADLSVVREALVARQLYSTDSLELSLAATGVEPAQGEEDLERAEARLVLRRALATLQPVERRTLDLRFGEDLSQQAIGERLGLSQIQVSRMLQRVLTLLRAAIGDVAAA